MPWKILSDPWEAGGGVPDGLATLALLFRQDFWEPLFSLSLIHTDTLSKTGLIQQVYGGRERNISIK